MALVLLIAVVLVLVLPRKYLSLPILLSIFLIPKGQVLVLAGTHFTIARVLFVAGLIRFLTSGGLSQLSGGVGRIDKVFTLWACSYFAVFSLQWMETQATIKSLGELLDALGGYYVLRYAIADREDVLRTIQVLARIAVVSAVVMMIEQITKMNPFSLLGGINDPIIRDGRLRSQAAFAVFITAGAFGGTVLPLMIWLWAGAKSKLWSCLGVLGATIMGITCQSSTSLLAYAAGLLALCFWPLRTGMRLIRWSLAILVVALHVFMNGPVWSLLEKIDLTGSSSSYHRYILLDASISHFGDWWLLGNRYYPDWGYFMWDMSNQYVAYALTGGLLTLVFFVGIIVYSFSELGNARKRISGNTEQEWALWCMGSTLFAHVVAYFGIGYFDQVQFAWFTLLALIVAATAATKNSGTPIVTEPEPTFEFFGGAALESSARH